jgi:hypothetical protein
MRLDGRLQVLRECSHYIGQHQACPSDSQEAILVRARSISEFRVAKTALVSSTRVALCQGVSPNCAPWTLNLSGAQFRAPVMHQFPLSYVDLSSDAQLLKVTRVREGPVALLACRFGEHTQVLQEVNGLAGGWLRRLE